MTAKSVARPASYNQTLLIPSRPIIQYFALRLLPAVVRGCFLNSAQRLGDLLPNRGGRGGRGNDNEAVQIFFRNSCPLPRNRPWQTNLFFDKFRFGFRIIFLTTLWQCLIDNEAEQRLGEDLG